MTTFSSNPDYTNEPSYDKLGETLSKLELQRQDLLEFAVQHATFKFKVGWFHRVLCDTLAAFVKAVEQEKSPRLIIEAPPRHSKSQVTVRALVPWVLGHHPDWEILVATYGQDLADDHGRDMRSVMCNPLYKRIFPGTVVDQARRSADNVGLAGHKGGFKAVGVGAAITGRGASCFVIDDPLKDLEEARSESHTQKVFDWYQSVASSRLEPGGGVIIMATRWSELDLTGRVLDSPLGADFHRLSFPALAVEDEKYRKVGEALIPERFSTAYLTKLRDTMPDPKIWMSLYQQTPYNDEGSIFKAQDLLVHPNPIKHENLTFYISLDPAASEREQSDYWAGLVAGLDHNSDLHIIDHLHMRGADAVGKYLSAVFSLVRKYKPHLVVMEKCHATNVLEPIIKRRMRETNTYFRYETLPTGNKDKLSRAQSIAARVAQHCVHFADTPFNRTVLIPELVRFPDAKNDDLVDCMSQFGAMLDTMRPKAPDIPLDPLPANVLDAIRLGKHRNQHNHGLAREPRKLF